jgi:hypothetical protein
MICRRTGERTALPTRYPSRVALGAPTRGDANGRGSPRSAAGAVEQAVSGGSLPPAPACRLTHWANRPPRCSAPLLRRVLMSARPIHASRVVAVGA